MRYFYEKEKHYIHDTFASWLQRNAQQLFFLPLVKYAFADIWQKCNVALTLITITRHLFSPLSSFQVNFTLLTLITCYCSPDSLKHSWEYVPCLISFRFTDNVWYRHSSMLPNQLSSPPVATACITTGPNMQQRSYQLSVVWLK